MINNISASDGGVAIGSDNFGNIIIGYPIEQHERALREREHQIRADLERAHAAEQSVLKMQLREIERQLTDLNASYEARVEDLRKANEDLQRLRDRLPADRLQLAFEALAQGDMTKADELFSLTIEKCQDAVAVAASAHFSKGLLAEADIRFFDAQREYTRAAQLDPVFAHLQKARELNFRLGEYDRAFEFGRQMIHESVAVSGGSSLQYGLALNAHGLNVEARGDLQTAKTMYKQSMDVLRDTLGEDTYFYAQSALNHALLCSQHWPDEIGFDEVEKISGTIEKSPSAPPGSFAESLNLLGTMHQAAGNLQEAETNWKNAMRVQITAYGESEPRLRGICWKYGRFLEENGRHREAIEQLKVAERVSRKFFRLTDESYVELVHTLSDILYKQRDFKGAVCYLRLCVCINKKTNLGLECVDHSVDKLSCALFAIGYFRTATRNWIDVLPNLESNIHVPREIVLDRMLRVMESFRELGKFTEAREYGHKCREFVDRNYHPGHPLQTEIAAQMLEIHFAEQRSIQNGRQ